MKKTSGRVFWVEEVKRRRRYDTEFKKEVLGMTTEGKPVVDVVRDLGISPDRIRKRRRDEKRRIRQREARC
jgi:transposase-like protein